MPKPVGFCTDCRYRLQRRLKADIRATGLSYLLPSWVDFLVWANAAVETYNNRPHRSLPKIRDAVTGRMRHRPARYRLPATHYTGPRPPIVLRYRDVVDANTGEVMFKA